MMSISCQLQKKLFLKLKLVTVYCWVPVGAPKYENLPFDLRPERGLLKLRKELDSFANIRPAKVFNSLANASSLKPDIAKNMDIVVLRELTGGIYLENLEVFLNLKMVKRRYKYRSIYYQ